MMSKPLRILVLEDSVDDYDLLINHLEAAHSDLFTRRVACGEKMTQELKTASWDLIISDYAMPRFSALDALTIAKKIAPEIPFIVVSGTIGEEVAVEVLRAGAADFFSKGRFPRLIPAIERELREAQNRRRLKEREEQIRQSQKMEAVGQLAGGVAHDFNNILALMLLSCDLLKQHIGENDPGFHELEQIRLAGERASALTKQLLAFSRKQVLEPKTIALDHLIRKMEGMLRRMVEKNVSIVTELGCGNSCVHIDPTQMDQVLMNLAVNARDAMTDGGMMTVTTERIDVTDAAPVANLANGPYLMLAVADTGVGMDAETQRRIFEPFFTTKSVNQGTGLGLATVYGIVQQSRGAIVVRSASGQGTTFSIYLPCVEGVETAAVKTKLKESGKVRLRLLLVEDESELRDAIRMTLELHGHEVIAPNDPAAAVGIMEKERGAIDLVITDVLMPGTSGVKIARAIQELVPNVKILYISGYFGAGQDQHQVETAQKHFLRKPFSMDDLVNKVDELALG